MVNLLISVSSSNISMCCNLILLGILILCALSCLMGLKKGLIKASLKLIVWLILILVVYLNNINFTKMVFNYSLSSFFANAEPIIVNEQEITLSQNIGGIIEDLLKAYNISSSQDAVSALAMSVLSFVVLIVNLILCLLISPILTFVLYILIVRPIFKKIMKTHKLRIGGLFVNGVKTLLVSVAFLTPLFSTAEVLMDNYKTALGDDYKYDKNQSNEYWNIIYPIANGYNSSLLHHTFSLITGQGKNNGFYSVKVNNSDTTVNFVSLLGDVFSVACSTLSIAEDTEQSTLIAALLTDKSLELLTTKVLNNAFLVNEVIPLVASISLGALENEENFILSSAEIKNLSDEIGNIDFGKDLSSYIELFRILNENGYIVDTSLKEGLYEFSNENKESINKALIKFKEMQNSIKDSGKKTLLEVILPPVLASIVKNVNDKDENELSGIMTIFPDNADEYRKYDIIDFVQVIVDVCFTFNDLYKETSSDKPNLDTKTMLSIDQNDLTDILFSKDIVNGTNVKTMDLFAGNSTSKGLLDIKFVLDRIPDLLDISFDLLPEGFITSETKESIKQEVSSLETNKETWCDELNAMFGFVSEIFNNADFPILTKDEKGNIVKNESITFDFENSNHVKVLKAAIGHIGNSKIVPAIIVPTIKEVAKINWNEIGINVDDLNFKYFSSETDLSNELIKLIDTFSEAYPLMSAIQEGNIFETGYTSEDLKDIFANLIDCEIINPKCIVKDSSGNIIMDKNNNAFRKIILKFFNEDTITKKGISLSEVTYDSLFKVVKDGTEYDYNDMQTEFEKFCDIYNDICEDDSLKSLFTNSNPSQNQTELLDNISGKTVSNLITHISESKIFKPCLNDVLNTNISPIINSFVSGDYFEFNYSEQKDISEDGEMLGQLIEGLKKLPKTSGGSIDVNAIIQDSNYKTDLQNILYYLVDLHVLENDYLKDGDDFVYDRVGLIVYDLISPSLKSLIDDSDESAIKKDFSFAKNDANYKNKNGDTLNEITRNLKWKEEIDKLMSVLFEMNGLMENGEIKMPTLDNSNAINDIKEIIIGNGNDIKGLNENILFRTIIANLLPKSIDEALNNEILSEIQLSSDVIIYKDALKVDYNYETDGFASIDVSSYDLETQTLREIEVDLRKNEIEHILSAFDLIVQNKDVLNGADKNNLINNCKGFFKELMNDLHDSLILHKPDERNKTIENSNKLTFFENVVLIIMDKSELSTYYYSKSVITDADASSRMKNKIINISKSEYSIGVEIYENNYLTWDYEIESIYNVMDFAVNDENYGSIGSLLESGMTNPVDIDFDNWKDMLKRINESYLLHDVNGFIANKLLKAVQIDSNEGGIRIDSNETATEFAYDFDKTEIYFADKVSKWNAEIDNIIALKNAYSYKDASDETKYFDLSSNLNLQELKDKIKIESILPLVAKSEIIKPAFYDFLYTFVLKINDESTDYGRFISIKDSSAYESDPYQVAKQRRDTLKYLGEEKINSRIRMKSDENISTWAYEGRLFDNLFEIISDCNIQTILSQIDSTLNDSQIKTITDLFKISYDYVGNAYNYALTSDDEGNNSAIDDMVNGEKYDRGYMLSEILFNLFKEKIEDNLTGITLFETNNYEYNYFNDYERDAFSALLTLRGKVENINSWSNLEDLMGNSSNFSKFGPGSEEIISKKRDAGKVLLSDGHNSNTAVQFINSGYLSKAFKASNLGQQLCVLPITGINEAIDNLFSVDNESYSVEYSIKTKWDSFSSLMTPYKSYL